MEKQNKIGGQNNQQIEQNPINQPVLIPEKPKTNYLVIGAIVLVCFIIFGFGGYFFSKQSSQNTNEEKGIRTSPTPVNTETESSTNWKTHTGTTVSFKFPTDWIEESVQSFGSRSVVEFKYKNTSVLELTIMGNYNQLSGKPFVTLEEYLGSRTNTARDTLVDGYPAKIVSVPGDPGHVIPAEEALLFNLNKSFLISLYYSDSYYDSPNKQPRTFDQILSSFKLVN